MKTYHGQFHALVLVLILAGGALTFWYASGNTAGQLAVASVMTVTYVCWGIIHHVMKGDLHRNVVIEYVLIGAIAMVLLLTLAL